MNNEVTHKELYGVIGELYVQSTLRAALIHQQQAHIAILNNTVHEIKSKYEGQNHAGNADTQV